MTSDPSSNGTKWIVGFLVDGDERGQVPREIQKAMVSAVLASPHAERLLLSNVARLTDVDESERRGWEQAQDIFAADG